MLGKIRYGDSGIATETKGQSESSDKSFFKVAAHFRNALCWETPGPYTLA